MFETLKNLVELDDSRVLRDMPWVYRELGDLMLERGDEAGALIWYRRYLLTDSQDEDRGRIEALVESYESFDPGTGSGK